MKKICVVTSTRADYGLLSGIIKIFRNDSSVLFDLVATGTHLNHEHGYTIDSIKNDGFKPIEIPLKYSGSSPADIIYTMNSAMKEFSTFFSKNRPDILVLLGDRYEIFSIAQVAFVFNIPIAHIHGGEVTYGAIDDSFRHSITKFSSLHFTSNEEHKLRVIQLGENPNTVYNFGAPGLDCITNLNLLPPQELEKILNINFNKKNILVTYHPTTTNKEDSKRETQQFFSSLNLLDLQDTNIFITLPNSDSYSNFVRDEIEAIKISNPKNVYIFKSLGQINYLSMMKIVDLIVGNSSSGIIEGPFMGKAVINVGNRQRGRVFSQHVIHTNTDEQSLMNAFNKALSSSFQEEIKKFPTLYGDGHCSQKIAQMIINKCSEQLLPKEFFDYRGEI